MRQSLFPGDAAVEPTQSGGMARAGCRQSVETEPSEELGRTGIPRIRKQQRSVSMMDSKNRRARAAWSVMRAP